ncbi:universal stress protein Usp [Desulfuromonas sp. DDH964]|uniref:universal stress protein n=1 Tax=Desulfuromonas sp. DDH964 TaxID=1823759 RepID=UPI00078D23BB|nr:universal stress protein [Desulfuromonas sp. DDH964]AMV73815.1 universal stress protein Usp [Desulfuromonas sp. DDH964]
MLPKISTIVYATGLGPGAPYVFRYALSVASQYDARIIAVNALEPLSSFGQSLVEQYISREQAEQMHRQARQSVKERLRERIERLCAMECESRPECRKLVSEILILEGQPAQVVLDAARECNADLIIMGSHRHTVLGDAMLGTTTHKVLHSSTRPVLVVRIPEGYREEGF